MPYVVTRQAYYYQRGLWVEVAAGGFDYSGPDMLVEKFKHLGEGQEFRSPVDAAAAAVAIAKAWRESEHVVVHLTAKGEVAGYFGAEGEAMSSRQVQRWAKKEYAHLDKCARCGEILPSKKSHPGRYYLPEYEDEGEFCSQHCSDLVFEDIVKVEVEEGFRCRECGEPVGRISYTYEGKGAYCSAGCAERHHGPSFELSKLKQEER